MNLAALFDRIEIINLPQRQDRRRHMQQQLRRIGLDDHPAVRWFPAIRPDHAGRFPSRGARGCFMSHLEVLRRARDDGVAAVLVMEDDLVVSPALAMLPAALTQPLQEQSWDLLYWGHLKDLPEHPPQWLQCNDPLQCAHFYAVHQRCLPDLIAYLEDCLQRLPGDAVGGPMHFDGALTMFRARNPLRKTLIAAPTQGYQRSSRSDISDNRWYDRWPLVRRLAATARELRYRRRQATWPVAAPGVETPDYYLFRRNEIMPLVPTAQRVLEIGCGAGATLAHLKATGKAVETWGVELTPAAAAEARCRVDQVFCCDIEQAPPPLPLAGFDVILCLDVLEHLRDPWRIMRYLNTLLRPGGSLIISVPNVRHHSVVLPLLFGGHWRYQEAGIMDRTHLRFFTREGVLELIEHGGLQVTAESHTGLERWRREYRWNLLSASLLKPLWIVQHLVRADKQLTT